MLGAATAMVILASMLVESAPTRDAQQEVESFLKSLLKETRTAVACTSPARPQSINTRLRPSIIVETDAGEFQLGSLFLIAEDQGLTYAVNASEEAQFRALGGGRYRVSLTYPKAETSGGLVESIVAGALMGTVAEKASSITTEIHGIMGTGVNRQSWCLDVGETTIRRIRVLR